MRIEKKSDIHGYEVKIKRLPNQLQIISSRRMRMIYVVHRMCRCYHKEHGGLQYIAMLNIVADIVYLPEGFMELISLEALFSLSRAFCPAFSARLEL